MQGTHAVEDLISIFNELFIPSLNTELVAGDSEPIYLPSNEQYPHNRIIFAHGFFSSALHEIAHWSVAGPERRQLEDFGYWYKPDGRTLVEQAEFERVECRPQAYEWILSASCGKRFHFSADNLSSGLGPSDEFKRSVLMCVHKTLAEGMNPRLHALSERLRQFYQQPELSPQRFFLPELQYAS